MQTSTSTDEIRELFDRYAETYATRDVNAIVALHAPDSQFWLHLDQEPAVGRDAIAEKFAGFFAQWPRFGFEVYRAYTGDDHWVLDWALTAELTGTDGTPVPVRFVADRLGRLADAGVTDFVAIPFGDADERATTNAILRR